MTLETIDHTALVKLAASGAVHSAHVVGRPGGWGVLIRHGTTECALATQRSQQVRLFRKFETLVGYLKGVGIVRFDVDAVNWDAAGRSTRPPSAIAATGRKASEAAAYDDWLRAEVQEAIDDKSPTIPHDEVKQYFADKREALRKRIAAEKV